jgi:hypothetical protein
VAIGILTDFHWRRRIDGDPLPAVKLPLLDGHDPIDAEEQARGHKTWMSSSRRQATEFSDKIDTNEAGYNTIHLLVV